MNRGLDHTNYGHALTVGMCTGRSWDAGSVLYYYRTRYVDPELGRFISSDSIGVWGDANSLGNGYAYVGNHVFWSGDARGTRTCVQDAYGHCMSDHEEAWGAWEDCDPTIFNCAYIASLRGWQTWEPKEESIVIDCYVGAMLFIMTMGVSRILREGMEAGSVIALYAHHVYRGYELADDGGAFYRLYQSFRAEDFDLVEWTCHDFLGVKVDEYGRLEVEIG